MKPAGLLLLAAFLALAAGPQFELTDERGKKPPGVTIEAGEPDADGWFALTLVTSKGAHDPVLVWPFDGMAKAPDGPEPIPVIVIQRGDEKALENRRVVAALAASMLLGNAADTGLDAAALTRAIAGLQQSTNVFEKGVALLFAKKSAEAAEALALALRERQRQLTPIPSEIYPAAILYGQALADEKKYDAAAVALLAAIKQRPSSQVAKKLRSDALVRAGKPEAF